MVGSRGTLWLGGQHYLGWEILTHLMLYEHDSLLDDGSWGRSFTTSAQRTRPVTLVVRYM